MAGVDHTIICFHNGKLMRSLSKEVDGKFESLIPFQFNRDAVLLNVYYDQKTIVTFSNNWLMRWIERKFADALSRERVGYLRNKCMEVITYQSEDFNVIFYLSGNETYVMLGGYGHYNNPYTHFYHRGYGEEFERKMAKECYEWLFEKILPVSVDWIPRFTGNHENEYQRLCRAFGFKIFWDMDREEQARYLNKPMIDLDN